MKTINVGLVGITGYAGMELTRLLVSHPSMRLAMACSRAESGKRLGDFYPFLNHMPGADVVISVFDPQEAARQYRARIVDPIKGLLPDDVVNSISEQLSGACTTEIAAFDEFTGLLTDASLLTRFDHIIFDTAPTGHTLRMLQLPSAWSTFISESTHGASCLGQLSGLEERKGIYKQAVETLSNTSATRLVLVSRPEISPLKEAARSSSELQLLGIKNQLLVINGILQQLNEADDVSRQLHNRQQKALQGMPAELSEYPMYSVPLRSYNLSDIANIRRMLYSDSLTDDICYQPVSGAKSIDDLVNDLYTSGKRVVFTMGKGGVGKTTSLVTIATGLVHHRNLIKHQLRVAVIDLDPQGSTSLAFGFGVLPLARATGAGAGSQNAIGIGVLGGMITARQDDVSVIAAA